ncbi:MAG: protein phosphatase 2C domain-containing protein [Candidatus Eiseniibacteriota bacterium]|jgi:serine/threonine protein phosphatase PrpC
MTTRRDGEPEFFGDGELERGVVRAFAGGEVCVRSARSPDKQGSNEDAVALIPLGEQAGVLALADGVGGLPDGAQASRVVLGELASRVVAAAREGTVVRDAILDGIESANQAVLALGGGASTLVAAEIDGAVVRSYHAGDSLILVTGLRGRVRMQTVPHSPIGYAVESGLMDAEEAMHHDARHLISNMIGSPEMRIELGPLVELHRYDTLLLASDGLADNLLPDEIVELIRKGRLAGATGQLFDACRRRMTDPEVGRPSKPDDVSIIAYRSRHAPR